MAYGTDESFTGVYVFCIDINNLTIFAGKPRKQTHLIIVRQKHLLHKVLHCIMSLYNECFIVHSV